MYCKNKKGLMLAVFSKITMATALVIVFFFLPIFSQAAIRDTVTYQAKVTDVNLLAPVDANYNMEFKIYDAASAGNLLWTETWNGGNQVTMKDGVFTVELNNICSSWTGACASNGGVDWSSDSLFLEVGFDADSNGSLEEVFSPRKRFTSSPYAQMAARLDTADDINFLDNTDHSLQWNEVNDRTLVVENDDATAVANLAVEGQMQTGSFSSAPIAVGNGALYYNITDNKLYMQENGSWVAAGSGSASGDAIWDTDSDTGIQTEEGADDDTIRFDIGNASGTAYPDILKIDGTNGLIWNDMGAVLDLRLEGDTDTNLFFIDGSADKIGLGLDNPNAKLEITASDADALRINPYGAVAGNTGDLEFMELAANGSNYVGFKAPDNIAADVAWVLPNADGNNGEVLSTDSSGNLSWLSVGDSGAIWDADTDTGIQVEETADEDMIRFDIGNSSGSAYPNAMVIDSDGEVGISTDTPDYNLDVAGDVGVDGYIYHNDDSNSYMYFTPDRWQLYTGGRSMIDVQYSASEVTINEGSTQTDFRVEGGTDTHLLFTDGSADNVGIGESVPDSNAKLEIAGNVMMDDYLYFQNTTTDYMRFDGSDFIFTNDILPSASSTYNLGSSTDRWKKAYLGGNSLHIGDDGNDSDISYDNVNNNLVINDGAESIGLRIESSTDPNMFYVDAINDRLGVGTNTPGAMMEINGGELWLYNDGNDSRFVIGDTGISGDYGYLQWDSVNDYFRIEKNGTNGMKINDNYVSIGNLYPDQPLKVANGSTELFRINTSGQVGINTSTLTASFEITPSTANALRINPYGAVAGNTGDLEFMELAANGSNYVGFKAPDNIAADVAWVLPNADGGSGEVLSTDGSGNLSWRTSLKSLWDADTDTGIQVEEGADDDTIRFDLGATANDALLLNQSTGLVWNDAGLSTLDFRIEGDTVDHLFFVDSDIDRVGIGTTTTPAALLTVGAGGHESSVLSVAADSAYMHIMNVRDEDGENIFQFNGSVANNDLELLFGDMDEAGNSSWFKLDSGNTALTFNNTTTVFNEAGGNFDFRIEGNSNQNLLVVDASEDRIGFGTNLPQYAFDLNYDPAASDTPLARLSNNSNVANPYALTLNNNYNQDIGLSLQNQGVMKWLIYNDGPTLLAEDDLVFESASGRAMTIEQDGYVAIGTDDASEDLVVGGDFASDLLGTRITVADASDLSGINFGEDINNRAWTLWDNTDNYLTLGSMEASTAYLDTLVLRDGYVGIGTNDPNSTFHNTGSFSRNTTSVSSSYTVAADDNVIFIDASSGDVTVTLPSTSGIDGREYIFKAMDVTNDIFLKAATSENIDGTNQYLMQNENDVVGVVNDGSNWMIAYYKSGEEFSDIDIGDGADGSQTVSASGTVLNTYTYLTGNETVSSTTITVNSTTGFAAGDEILIHQSQDNANSNEGVYEFAEIQSILGNVITLDSGISNAYFSGTFNALAAEVTQVVRVPNYTDITIQSGASITALDWNGYRGGIVVFRANGTVDFATGNSGIDVAGLGFRGGDDNGGGDGDPGDPGEGFAGLGWDNDATTANCNANENGGGGGYGPTGYGGTAGGGGGNRAGGGDATDADAPPAIAQGGDNVGDSAMATIFLGGGGGGGGDNDSHSPPAYGGDGGGIVIVFAKKITKALVDVTGEDGADGGTASAGDGGGGAGGTVWLNAFSFTADNIDVSGGAGGTDGGDFGGDGGEGWYVNGSSAAASSGSAEGFYFGIDATGGTDCNGPCQVPWDNDSRIDTEYYTHSTSINSSQVTVKKSGWYKISYTVTFDNNGDGNNDRVTMRCRLRRDGSTYVNGSAGRTYMRDYSYGEYGSITNTSLVRINANSYIEVECEHTSGSTGGTDVIANEASILIEMLN